jgi:type IV secretion system protein VirB6
MYNIFAFVDGQFQNPLQNFISIGTSNIANWVVGPITVALTLYVVLYGFLILRGSVQEPITDFAFRAMKLAVILMLVRNAAEAGHDVHWPVGARPNLARRFLALV